LLALQKKKDQPSISDEPNYPNTLANKLRLRVAELEE
jgi:hypothetical protein